MSIKSEKPKGFAGLEDMTSEVNLPDSAPSSVKATPTTAQDPIDDLPRGRPFEIDESRLQFQKPKGMSVQKKWMIGIGIYIALAVIFTLFDKKSGGGDSAPTVYEDMPTPASGQLLSDNQIRYCLSQDIRLTSWSSAVDHYSQTAIDSFNAAISDYNSRCASYKYRKGSLERVRNEVEAHRTELQSDGASKAAIFR